MPLTEDLRPGKFVSILGQPHFEANPAPSYNGTLNKFAANMNNTNEYKVFEKINGKYMTQNGALIAQDNFDITQDNKDLAFNLKNKYIPTSLDEWEQLPDYVRWRYPRPRY
jgi:hypothetical protein